MARLEDLIGDVENAHLRAAISAEVKRLKDQTKFGLVFERHHPENVLLASSAGLRVGDLVRLRKQPTDDKPWRVTKLSSKSATLDAGEGESLTVAVTDLLVVKGFSEPVYPTLRALGSIERGSDRAPHLVIKGENFHALELLTFTHAGRVDCIYIDPPYNTGARDWKYNNDYVDDKDRWRHSKWLSMMEKRLRLAKRLLRADGVLIVTIDQNELHHLSLLLEDVFPGARRQIASICINPSGAGGEGLSRVEEYAVFCFLGDSAPVPLADDLLIGDTDNDGLQHDDPQPLTWESLLRRGNAWYRTTRPNLCYPVLLSKDGTRIVRAGEPFSGTDESKRAVKVDGLLAAWPVRKDGKLGIWRVDGARLNWLAERGYACVTGEDKVRGTWSMKYLMTGVVAAIEAGAIKVTGTGQFGEAVGQDTRDLSKTAKTMWYRGRHTAGGSGGTQMLNALLGERNIFSFPKSVYAVQDSLNIAVGDRPDAVILDFFAGSGTTLHTTALMNAMDGGNRQCILATNNEVREEQARALNGQGLYPGDPDFERHGVFEAATRPRCEAAITGRRPDGEPAPGHYLNGRSLSEGFDENVQFLEIDYLDPDRIELGTSLEALHSVLWAMAGARAPLPAAFDAVDGYCVVEDCGYAVLFDQLVLSDLVEALNKIDGIEHVFLCTDYPDAYAEMSSTLGSAYRTHMVPRDYLRHFRLLPGSRQ